MNSKRAFAILLSIACVTSTSSCGDRTTVGASGEDLEYLAERQEARGSATSGRKAYDSIDDLLPNVSYVSTDGRRSEAVEAVVVGRVTSVAPGVGFEPRPEGDVERQPGTGDGDGDVVDFDDPNAMWRTVELKVTVDSVIAGDIKAESVDVGYVIAPIDDFESVASGFVALGDVVLLLDRSVVFAYNPGLYGVVSNGRLLLQVASDGELALPFENEEESRDLMRDVHTLDALKAAASAPKREMPAVS